MDGTVAQGHGGPGPRGGDEQHRPGILGGPGQRLLVPFGGLRKLLRGQFHVAHAAKGRSPLGFPLQNFLQELPRLLDLPAGGVDRRQDDAGVGVRGIELDRASQVLLGGRQFLLQDVRLGEEVLYGGGLQ